MKCSTCAKEVDDNEDSPIVCTNCGASLVADLIQKINKSERSLRSTYRRCYEALKLFQKKATPDLGATIYDPKHPVNLGYIDKLLEPLTISPLAVVAFGLSVSRHRLECFYKIRLPESDDILGAIVNNEILNQFRDAPRLSQLMFHLPGPFLPSTNFVSTIISGEMG